jgi:hypothetical protein
MIAKHAVSAVVLLCLAVPASAAQSAQSKPQPAQSKPQPAATTPADETTGSAVVPFAPSLAGTWKGATERLPLTGDFNEKVWGKNAASVRDVTLTIKPSGDATLVITRKVLDARGRVVAGSSSVEEADVTIGAAKPGFSTRLNHEVTVVKAERRYPDNPNDRWPLDGLRVGVVSFTDGMNSLEVRFDPKDGQGAFAELLTKSGSTGARSTAKRPARK